MSVGIGYDSHRFGAGRPLVLGGVEVEHELGLEGHSDADVLTHAVIDALLGAGGLGDIGTLFPDDDERWRDADSIDLLRTVVGMISGRIENIDATVVCEEPRLGPLPGGDGADPRRGHLGPGQRQGDDQRGDGLDRPRRGNRLHSGGFGGERIVFAARDGQASAPSRSSVRKTVADKAFEVEGRCTKPDILGLMRPDVAAKIGATFVRWGPSPATGIAIAAIHYPDETAIIDERGSLTFDQLHRRSNALAHALAADGARVRRRGRGDVPQPPRLHRGHRSPAPSSAPARST